MNRFDKVYDTTTRQSQWAGILSTASRNAANHGSRACAQTRDNASVASRPAAEVARFFRRNHNFAFIPTIQVICQNVNL